MPFRHRSRQHAPQALEPAPPEKIDEECLRIVIRMMCQQAGIPAIGFHQFRKIGIAQVPRRHLDRNFMGFCIPLGIERSHIQSTAGNLSPFPHKTFIPFRLLPPQMEIAVNPSHLRLRARDPVTFHQMRQHHRVHASAYGKEQPLAPSKKPLLLNIRSKLLIHLPDFKPPQTTDPIRRVRMGKMQGCQGRGRRERTLVRDRVRDPQATLQVAHYHTPNYSVRLISTWS